MPVLLFDQIETPDGQMIPFDGSLDTSKGTGAIKVKGKTIKNAKVVVASTIVGGMVGNAALGDDGSARGTAIGVAVGTGLVMLSDMKEIKLPAGTELIIKCNADIFIPKMQSSEG